MTCSLQTYRTRIGTYNIKQTTYRKEYSKNGTERNQQKQKLLISLVLTNYCLLVLLGPSLLCPYPPIVFQSLPSRATSSYTSSNQVQEVLIITTQSHTWDPGTAANLFTFQSYLSWITSTHRNKLAHITYGNRGQRGRGITVVYWNKGPSYLHNKQHEIESLVSTHKPHILGLGEANFRHDHSLEDVQLQGYTLHLDSSVDNPELGLARVAVYTHNALRVKRRPDLEDEKIAAIWLQCGLPHQKGILVCIGYRQWRLVGQGNNTSASIHEQFSRWSTFLDKWEAALGENKEVLVTLDANIDHLTWRDTENLPSHHSSVRLKTLIDALFDRILPLGVTQLVTGATRMQRGQPQAGLDHLYSNKPDRLSRVSTFFTGVSDHKLLKVQRFTKSFKQLPRFVKKRSYKEFDEELFRENIKGCGLEDIWDCSDVNIATELLTDKMTKVLDWMAPIKKFQTRTKYAPWLSKETKELKVKREAAQAKATETGTPEDWRLFRSIRNQVTAKCREDKRKWEKEKLDAADNSSTKIWKTVRGWLGWGISATPTQIFWEGSLVTSPKGLCMAMNKFFLEKIRKLRDSIPEPTADPLKRLKEAMQGRQCSFQLDKVEEKDVFRVIKALSNSSATGVDYIDTKTIKLVANEITPVLTYIINLSIETSVFPDTWKWAKVIPLLKTSSADPILPKSYRPVALLPVLSKVLEKVVFGQLVQYLEKNNLIHPNLHGSRAGHNTSTALNQLYDRWVEQVEEGNMVGVLFCDQSAAFDLCDHNILLDKLSLMGVEASGIQWIRSYLSRRKQSCFVDGEMSCAVNLLDCGVPQGSIGGPLLWVCFTSDQPDIIHDHPVTGHGLDRGCGQQNQPEQGTVKAVIPGENGCGELVGYVDDGAYSYAHTDPAVLSRILTEKYNMLEQWMNDSKLVINPDKTHMMVMGSKRATILRRQVTMMAGNFTIKPTETEKLLGGYIHHSLKWNQHLTDNNASLTAQLTRRINGLKKIASNASFSTRLMVANGAVQSKLVYLITLWGGATGYLLKALQVQQLNAARVVCGPQSLRWCRRKLLKRVGWMSVRQLIFFHTVLQAHKTLTSGVPAPLHAALTASDQHYRTRSVARGNIRLGEGYKSTSTFKYRAQVFYNTVPVEVKTGSLASVKRKLKQWVLQNVAHDWSQL